MPTLPEKFPFDVSLTYRHKKWQTDPRFGQPPRERTIEDRLKSSVINFDKPPNVNSHQITAYLKKTMKLDKVGHGGTLDPNVSGLLPIAIGRATPIARVWLHSDKQYIGVMRLHEEVPKQDLLSVLKTFTGTIYQRPPKLSSVKRETRKRTIQELQLIETKRRDVLLRITCEAGTYIRKLFHDIGEVLGVGAHMVDLRRIKSGPFKENDNFVATIQDIIDAWHFYSEDGDELPLKSILLPPEAGILSLPRVIVEDGAIGAITYGAPIYVPGIIAVSSLLEQGDLCVALSAKGELIALFDSCLNAHAIVSQEKGQVTENMRVLMKRGVYPSSWKE